MRSEAEITEHDRILAREAFGLLWGKNMSDVNFVEAFSPYIAAARREGAEEERERCAGIVESQNVSRSAETMQDLREELAAAIRKEGL